VLQTPVAQSASVSHEVLHALGPQTNGAQALVVPGWQPPAPSQMPAVVWLPLAQVAGTHTVPGT
jgi:hypothetical protein